MVLTWIDKMLTDVAVYWEPPIRDGLGGYTWAYPVEVKSAWQYKPSISYDSSGAVIPTNSEVWVNYEVINGGYLWRGSINELKTIFDPDPDFDLDNIPDEKIRDMSAQIVKVHRVESLINSKLIVMKVFLV